MPMLRRILNTAVLLLAANALVLAVAMRLPGWVVILGTTVLLAWFAAINIRPMPRTAPDSRTQSLSAGCELILLAACCLIAETLIYVCLFLPLRSNIGLWPLIFNAVICLVLTGIVVGNGFARIMFATRRLRLGRGVLLTGLWWVPVAGPILLELFRRSARAELAFVTACIQRDEDRRDAHICQTRYPLLMVHGIFFRDWPRFNYWGRIPDSLARNGASIHYGGQQSSSSVADSAAELGRAIEQVCEETGADKVNVIAHSKGGLDIRYAISRLGLGDKVASLTTVNTPHRGTVLAESLISATPDRVVLRVGTRYDALFAKLGDDQPDFLAGITELTPQACATLNEHMPDDPRVLYQSCGSLMRGHRSAPFPLNLGYQIIRPKAGDNDGLVDVASMPWGEFVALVRGTAQPGVSHGDMIDLFRRDIPGFDVCEFYVQLVAGLRERGL